MINKEKTKVSFYQNSIDTTTQSWIDIDEALRFIKYSPDKLINMTKELNILYIIDKDRYKQKKKQLPMICASGCFTYRNSDLSNLKEYSNILILDFDWENPNPLEIDDFRHRLIQYSTPLHIYAVWKSPAKGLKAAMIHSNTDSSLHTELFIQVKNMLYSKNPQLDMTGKDIGRACFLCHDPDLFINKDPNLKEFQFQHNPSFPSPSPITVKTGTRHTYGQFEHTSQEVMMNKGWQLTCTDKKLMNILIKSFNRENPDYYKDGNRHKEVLKRATLFCKDGVLYENALQSLIGQFGENSRSGLNSYDIESMVNSCYNKARDEFGMDRDKFLKSHYG